jgi:hypothetical protein
MNRSSIIAAALMGVVAVAESRGAKVLVVDDPHDAPPPPDPRATPDPVPDAFVRTLRESAEERLAKIRSAQLAAEGKRQGERIARRKHDFSASERCLERIRQRNAKGPR